MTWLTTANPGAAFAPTEFASYFFDHLTARSVALESGFRVVHTRAARLHVPRLLDDGVASWTPEGAEITPTDPNADSIVATPRKLAALTYASNELVADSNPSAQNTIAEQLARALALKLDVGLFEGSGTAPEIRGLKNQSGIQTVSMGTDGDVIGDLDPFAEALGLLATANADGTAITMHPRTWAWLTKLKDGTGSSRPLLVDAAGAPTEGPRRSILGVPVFLTSQLSVTETQGTASDASSVYVYDAQQVVVVLRSDATVEVDRSVAFSSDRTAIRAVLRADLVVPNPSAVVRITGVIPA
jgi:HK97 family phage major capsid protein